MNFRQLILLSLAIGGAPPSHAAIILDRSGDITAQCCQFAALAINWTMDREWTNVKIELDLHNDADEGEVHTGVALLLNSLGPGTTEAANEIDDVVVAEGGVDQKAVTLFQGLTLGPGTYHLVYYRLSYDFPYFLSVALGASPDGQVTGPGVTVLPTLIEGVQAAYRPASTWNPFGDFTFVHITGTPSEESAVPEPSTASLLVVAGIAGATLRFRRLHRTQ